MINKLYPLGKMWLQAAAEVIVFFPVALILYLLFISNPLWPWLGVLMLFYTAGYAAFAYVRLVKGYSLTIASLMCSGIIAIGLFSFTWSGYVTWFLGFYLFFRGVNMAKKTWDQIFPPYLLWIGLLLYFVESVIFHFNPSTRYEQNILFWLGLLNAIMALFILSQTQIISVSMPTKNGRHMINSTILWQNRLLIVGLLAVIFVVASIKQLAEALLWLNKFFWKNLDYLVQKLNRMTDKPIPDAAVNTPNPIQALPQASPSAFWIWLEKAVFYLFAALIFVALVILLYFLGKRLFRTVKIIYKWLMLRLNNQPLAAEKGYEDESTKLFSWKNLKDTYRDLLTDGLNQLRAKEAKWDDLTNNAERIRFLYRQLLIRSVSKGFEFNRHLTVQETMIAIQQWKPDSLSKNEHLSHLYNQARYSDHPITDQEVIALREEYKRR
ncbi:MAG: hypothetical protein JWM44_2399 [Bacilli bacterium]|nr:hypothetical protein [Bacilli bacterium]